MVLKLFRVTFNSNCLRLLYCNHRMNSTINFSKMEKPPKPPNIFIYTGEEQKINELKFENLKNLFQLCLNPERYIIYHLQFSKISQLPWQDNTIALIVDCEFLSDKVAAIFQNYVYNGGQLLSLCSNFALPGMSLKKYSNRELKLPVVNFSYKHSINISALQGLYEILIEENALLKILAQEDDSSKIAIISGTHAKGIVIISQVHLALDAVQLSEGVDDFSYLKRSEDIRMECLRDLLSDHFALDCNPVQSHSPSPAYLMTKNNTDVFLSSLQPYTRKGRLKLRHTSLEFHVSYSDEVRRIEDFSVTYPLILDKICSTEFNKTLFFEHLHTRLLGTSVFYADSVISTMDLVEGLPLDIGCVAIASRQISGKGRSGNVWLSPEGCAMFSVQLCISRNTPLGQSLSFVQHLATLAVIQAVKTLPGPYKDLDIGIKWPNDLYYARKVKIGGVLAASTLVHNTFHCYIGCGVNLSNSHPTVCLNDLIHLENRLKNTQMVPLSREIFIARVLNQLERLVDKCQEQGVQACLPAFYDQWIHQNQMLTLSETSEQVRVDGLDESGFLLVTTTDGVTLTLHPDGNSLDQMRNLIIYKPC